MGDDYGSTIVLTPDGSKLVIGCPGRNNKTGCVYVYSRVANHWSLETILQAHNKQPNDWFGSSIAISANGTTIVVGANCKDNFTGQAYVFNKVKDAWSEGVSLDAAPGMPEDNFGWSIAISANGNVIAIGCPGKNHYTGTVIVFIKHHDEYRRSSRLTVSDSEANDHFGESLAISSDGSTIIVGADGKNDAVGAVFVCNLEPSLSHISVEKVLADLHSVSEDLIRLTMPTSDDIEEIIMSKFGYRKVYAKGDEMVFVKAGEAEKYATLVVTLI